MVADGIRESREPAGQRLHAEKIELHILHGEMVKSCDNNPEENRNVRKALSRSLVLMAGPS
jgi:hypothetical protein